MNKDTSNCYIVEWDDSGERLIYDNLDVAKADTMLEFIKRHSCNVMDPHEAKLFLDDIEQLINESYIDGVLYICSATNKQSMLTLQYNPDDVALTKELICDMYRSADGYGWCMGQKFTPQVFCNGDKSKCRIVNLPEDC